MKFIWIEIIKFFKQNIFKLILGTLAISSLFVGLNYLNSRNTTSSMVKGLEDINFRPDAKPANFYFYISKEDGEAFTNNLLIEEYITLPETLEEASRETNTNVKEIVEKSNNTAIVDYHDLGPVKVLGVDRHTNNNLKELYINIGNEEDNLAIAQYFYDFIITDGLPFLEGTDIYVFQTPEIKEVGDGPSVTTSEESTTGSGDILITAIVALVLGLTFTTGLLLLITFISKKLFYCFSYSLRETDYFVLADEKEDNMNELKQLLTPPSRTQQLIVQQEANEIINPSFNHILNSLQNEDGNNYTSSFGREHNLFEINRIVYVIYEGVTSREWYNQQRRLDRFYDLPTVVIQVNKSTE